MIMKAKYLKPTTECLPYSIDELMITASGNGQQIVEDGGTTEDTVTEGDARELRNIWGDED